METSSETVSELENEKASLLAEISAVRNQIRGFITNESRNFAAEILSYHRPPPHLIEIFRALVLLLYSERVGNDWSKVKTCCNNPGMLVERIIEAVDNQKIFTSEILNEAEESYIRIPNIKNSIEQVSLFAYNVYLWLVDFIHMQRLRIRISEIESRLNRT